MTSFFAYLYIIFFIIFFLIQMQRRIFNHILDPCHNPTLLSGLYQEDQEMPLLFLQLIIKTLLHAGPYSQQGV